MFAKVSQNVLSQLLRGNLPLQRDVASRSRTASHGTGVLLMFALWYSEVAATSYNFSFLDNGS